MKGKRMNGFFELNNLKHFYSEHPNSIVFAYLAIRYAENGDGEKAREIAEQGSRQHPTYALGHFASGLSHYALNDLTKAKTSLELALAYDEKNPRAWKLLSEINKKLDLPLLATDGDLQYFLLDPFSPDAYRQFQQKEMAQFDVFEDEPSGFALPQEMPKEPDPVEDKAISDAFPDPEASIEELFLEEEFPEESIDISQKVDEVFKETMGDMSIERDLVEIDDLAKTSEEPQDNLDETDAFDDTFESIELIELDSEPQPANNILDDTVGFNTDDFADTGDVVSKKPETGPKEFEEMGEFDEVNIFGGIDDIADEEIDMDSSLDINAELDDFFSEYEMEEVASDNNDDTGQIDFGNILFDENTGKLPPSANLDDVADEELLDYSAMVDDIISTEPNDRSTIEAADVFKNIEVEEDTNIPMPVGDATKIDENGGFDFNFSEEEAVAPSENETKNSAANPFGHTTRFGRPPILSPTLGEIYISQGRYEEAVEVFQQLLEKDPENRKYQKKVQDIGKLIAKKNEEG